MCEMQTDGHSPGIHMFHQYDAMALLGDVYHRNW